MIPVMLISPDNNDQGADGHEPAVDVEGGQDGRHAVGDDEDMPDMMPTGAESEQEADARRARIAERLGTEAEWEGIVAPPVPEDLAGHARPPRGERIRPVAKPVAPTRRERERHELCHDPYALMQAGASTASKGRRPTTRTGSSRSTLGENRNP